MTSAYIFIKGISATLAPEVTFGYGEREWQNLLADKDNFPVVYLDEPVFSEDKILAGGVIDVNYRISMVFLDQTALDWTPEQHDEVISRMRTLARQFVIKLSESKDIYERRIMKSVTGIRRTNIKNIFDLNASGCVLEFTFTPLGGDSICPDENIDDEIGSPA